MSKAQNLVLKWWTPTTDSPNLRLTPENLRPLMSDKTVFVACTHASNVLGTIQDVAAIAQEVHKVRGALLCVDGVALAPHRGVDVGKLGVDFYAFSWYKVPRSPPLYVSSLLPFFLLFLPHPSSTALSKILHPVSIPQK